MVDLGLSGARFFPALAGSARLTARSNKIAQ
jgi:hypothetical protein